MSTVQAEMKREPPSFTLKSAAERDILTLVRYLTTKPLTVKDIRRELLQSYSELQILKAILSLLERGQLETVYPCGFELGFRAAERN